MNDSRLHETILTLYRGCRDIPLPEFKGWAMEVAQKALAFDSGIWVTSDIVSDVFSSVYLFHQPNEMMENYMQKVRLSDDHLAQKAIAYQGRTILANQIDSHPDFPWSPEAVKHIHRYHMAHALCTCQITPVMQIFSAMSFYRADPEAHFSEEERQIKELLMPHMIEAMRVNLFSWLNTSKAYEGNALAVCDAEGRLYEATSRFSELLHTAWPEWSGPRLRLPFDALAERGESRWSDNGLKFQASPCQDLFLVSAAVENILERLSARQLEVVNMLAMGRRYKDIAKNLNISPSTVTKHVNQIYERLELSKREDLVKLLMGR